MKYQKPTLTYLAEATAAIQGVNPGQGKMFAHVTDGADAKSSSIAAYPVEQ